MHQNWRDYADHYVIPYIGHRDVLDIDGGVCDALYAKLLAEGRVKAKPKMAEPKSAVRCYRTHAEDDPLLGQSIEPSKVIRQHVPAERKEVSPTLAPKTVVNRHRMLHRAWEDFTKWNWAKRNVVNDVHSPRVPRTGRTVWTVQQLQTFLQFARHDRFFAIWVLETTSKRIGHADVAFTMKQYVQTDLEADREVATTLADLIIGAC
jgi:hypothetical protein